MPAQPILIPRADERELLALVRAGHEGAFEQIFHAYYEPLLRYAMSSLHARDAAEEVVQDVFLNLWARRAAWTVQTTIAAYLFGATHHRTLNALRARRTDPRWGAVTLDTPVARPYLLDTTPSDERAVTAELREALTKAIEQLPPRCRETYVLARHHGLSHDQIAEVMGVSPKTVQEQMGRALRMLRQALAPFFENT